MQDPIALLQSLTLPAGATTGARIELDGTTGEIRFYSAAGNLVLQLDGAAQLRFFQDIVGGGLIGAHQIDDLLMIDPGAIANTFEVLPTGAGVDVLLWGHSLPRGILPLGYQISTANDVARAAGVATDLALTVDADATRLYRVHHIAQVTVGTAAAVYAISLTEDGTVVGRFGRWSAAETAAGSTVIFCDSSILWTPAAGSHTLRVINDAGSGGNITETASAVIPRGFWVEDIGGR